MRDGHPQDRQLVRFPREGTAGRHHVRQLRDVGSHFVSPPPLDLAMVFSTAKGDNKIYGCVTQDGKLEGDAVRCCFLSREGGRD